MINKQQSKRTQRQRLAIAGFAQLQKSAFDSQIGAQDDDFMGALLSMSAKDRGTIAKELLMDLRKE